MSAERATSETGRGARRRVLILGDETKGEVTRHVRELSDWIGSRAELAGVDLSRTSDLTQVRADLVVAFGGDGTILGAARRMGHNQMPTLGINLGKLGFLSETSVEEARLTIDRALTGQLLEEPRMMLECTIERAGTTPRRTLALNDGVLLREASAAILRIAAFVGDSYVTSYSGDGLIVAGPVGSTAYSLSAGGPILSPVLDALVLTPLAPHALTVRPLVVPAAAGVRLAIEGSRRDGGGVFVADGQVRFDLGPDDRVSIQRSTVRFRLLTEPGRSFFEILRRKFGWAGSPKYEGKG